MNIFCGSYPKNRMRRLRKSPFSRALTAEHNLHINDLIYPLFVMEDNTFSKNIKAMPEIQRVNFSELLAEAEVIVKLGIQAVALFPVVADDKKSLQAQEAYNDDSLIARSISLLKKYFPELGVIADVALDPYTSHGQDGVIDDQGYILNDITNEILQQQALCYAAAGVDVVAPSDMMDGRVGVIRDALEANKFTEVQILSYAAKYASGLYSPFRDAVGSAKNLAQADKKTYQMQPANTNEALREVALDLQEGADMVMVKPGSFYLDIVSRVKQEFLVPTLVYQVSAEYAMIMAAAQNGWIDKEKIALESLLGFKRAGADAILTYFAKDIALCIVEKKY